MDICSILRLLKSPCSTSLHPPPKLMAATRCLGYLPPQTPSLCNHFVWGGGNRHKGKGKGMKGAFPRKQDAAGLLGSRSPAMLTVMLTAMLTLRPCILMKIPTPSGPIRRSCCRNSFPSLFLGSFNPEVSASIWQSERSRPAPVQGRKTGRRSKRLLSCPFG